jgi:hypothetical protein
MLCKYAPPMRGKTSCVAKRFEFIGREPDAPRQDLIPMRAFSSIIVAATAVVIAAAAPSPTLADVRCGPGATTRVGVAPPPPLPETDQPPMPAYGYEWTPGAWSWNPDINDYYWTPGAWVLPPAIGLFWTPGYWAWDDGVYLYNAGYWGPHVGFYGGIDYGFGYWGHGYDGGYWRGRTFYYNRAYNNIGRLHINALYERRAPGDRRGGRASYNGGPGGVVATKGADERLADRDSHIAATNDQARHSRDAAQDPALRASVNHGHPRLAGAATAPGHVAAGHAEVTRAGAAPAWASHAAARHVESRRTEGHADMSRGSVSHTAHAPPAFRREPVVQPRRDAGYSHYAPAYRPPVYRAPAYRAPVREMSQPFHAEPQRFAAPRPAPAREGPPRGGETGRPH